jgi:DNA-binding MarR family transcriptional regulator
MATASAKEAPASLPDDGAGLKAWRAFLIANTALLRELDEELQERHDCTLGDYDVLIHLANAPERRLRMCDLAHAILLSPSGLSRRVDRLERAGLVSRERSETDARSIEACLTSSGRRFLDRLRPTHRAGIKERFVDRFSDTELETLAELLGRLSPDRP